jgi:cytoskeletal protein CcmA (bactofilin family)
MLQIGGVRTTVSIAATHPVPAPRPGLSINSRTTIVGTVYFDGPVHVDGVVQGEVRCKAITVSERGTVDGLIVADTVTVAGEVNGSIYANDLVLKSACDVQGDIFHRQLDIEIGSFFEGQSRHAASPLKLAPPED